MGYDYSYNPDFAEGIPVMSIIGVMLVIYLLIFAFAVVRYVLESLGMYTIAKRRGIKCPWLAWIPAVNVWILGSISDQYQYLVKGKTKNRRTVLLVLTIITVILSIALSVIAVGMLTELIANAQWLESMSEPQIMEMILVPMLKMSGVSLVMMGVGIALLVFEFIALYDLYTSCDPRNNVMFLVLSIVFSVTEPFFVFACRKKDQGMPPRKDQIPASFDPWNHTDIQ